MAKASDNEFPSVLFAEQAAAPTTPAVGFWRAYFKSDGMYVVDDAGAETGPFGSGGGAGVTATQVVRTSDASATDDYTLNSTSWADVDGTNLVLTLAASAGDVIEAGLSALTGSQVVELYLDAVTYVGGSPVNHISGAGGATGRGVQAWTSPSGDTAGEGRLSRPSGSILYTVQAGDIDAGNVSVRLRYRTSTTTAKDLFARSTIPIHFWMKNLG